MKSSKGFTLIELIVVMTVFLFIIGAALNIFISIIQSQRRILSEQKAINQISYAQEYMSKAIRMAKTETSENCLLDSQGTDYPGYIYLLTRPDNVTGFYRGIKFINQSDDDACQEFFWDTGDHVLKEIKDGNSPVALISSDLRINSVIFGINSTDGSIANSPNSSGSAAGASSLDGIQPRVTVLLNIDISGEQTKIIQTVVSQRNLNLPE